MDARAMTRVPLGRFVNAARIGQLQEAARVVHSHGKTGLGESLREWTEQLIEVLAVEDGYGVAGASDRSGRTG